MSVSVQISDELAAKAETISEVFNRSLAGQIEYRAGIGQIAEENSDLPLSFISDILKGKQEIKSGLGEPYIFGEGE